MYKSSVVERNRDRMSLGSAISKEQHRCFCLSHCERASKCGSAGRSGFFHAELFHRIRSKVPIPQFREHLPDRWNVPKDKLHQSLIAGCNNICHLHTSISQFLPTLGESTEAGPQLVSVMTGAQILNAFDTPNVPYWPIDTTGPTNRPMQPIGTMLQVEERSSG